VERTGRQRVERKGRGKGYILGTSERFSNDVKGEGAEGGVGQELLAHGIHEQHQCDEFRDRLRFRGDRRAELFYFFRCSVV
jgi:hypothetical protein